MPSAASKSEERALDSAMHRLADFVHGVCFDQMPLVVRRQASLSLVDTIGCMLAGAETADAKMLFLAEQPASGRSTVLGSGMSLNSRAAARCNGYFGDIFEMNDLTGGHASIGNAAAALALAEEVGASGAEMLVAFAAGVEVTARIYNALYPTLKPYDECGMVPVGLPSSVGAAAVAARLLKLNGSGTRRALGIAAGLAGWCPAEVIFGDGSTLKPMLFGGWPASVGLLAAQYAAAGMTESAQILESPIGYFAHSGAFVRPICHRHGGVGARSTARKLHACCGYIHSALDLVLRIRARAASDLEGAKAIDVFMPGYVMPAIAKSHPPETANQARFDARYCPGARG